MNYQVTFNGANGKVRTVQVVAANSWIAKLEASILLNVRAGQLIAIRTS